MSFVAPVREDWPSRLPMPDWVAWGVLASLLLHVALLGAAVWWPRRPAALPPLEEGVAVDFVTPEQFAAATAGGTAPPTAPAAPGMIHATAMLSAQALADPKSASGRAVFAQLNAGEKSVQLCDLEAMEQVHAWKATFNPERIIAYATAEVAIAGDTIKAPGAAFFSGGNWYALAFDCVLSPDQTSVIGLDFHVGDPIPRDRWDADSLPTAK